MPGSSKLRGVLFRDIWLDIGNYLSGVGRNIIDEAFGEAIGDIVGVGDIKLL